ncbi:MAG: hypothetical protein Q8865_04830 [Bacillota bacterium]|nr:hypothetical protein [Bacillota bacterium]
MCKTGDIIVVNNFKHNGVDLSRHSFVVLSDVSESIQGLDYDIVCNVMSSFKNEEQKRKKLSYPGNFPITYNQEDMTDGNRKSGFIKAEQFYYFNKEKTDFTVIGRLTEETFDLLIKFIEELQIDVVNIVDNL